MSTLSTLKSKLRNYLKCDPADKIWAETQKDEYINNAYFHVQKDGNFNWPENQADVYTFNTSVATATYSLPTDFIRLDLVQITNINREMGVTTKREAMRRGTNVNSQPSQYYIFGGQLGFYPTPDATYPISLLYRKRLATMTASVDCDFPVDFDDAIIKYAAYQIWATTKNSAKAAQALQDYKLVLDTLKVAFQVQDSKDFNFAFQKFSGSRHSSPRSL